LAGSPLGGTDPTAQSGHAGKISNRQQNPSLIHKPGVSTRALARINLDLKHGNSEQNPRGQGVSLKVDSLN
jgi:hypothetical protein